MTFTTVRHRTKVTKGPGSKAAGIAMAFKLIEAATRNRAEHRSRLRCGLARCLVRELVAVPSVDGLPLFAPGKTRRIS